VLARLRGSARTISGAVLVALTSLVASAVVPHVDDCHDDSLCAASVFLHDASTHSVQGAPDTPDHPLHCVMCHVGRSFRPSAEAVHNLTPSPARVLRDQLEVATVSASSPSSRPPLRSPPSFVTPNA
jgi:hypothetical protein